jgi:hypothetical protein
MPEIYGPSNQVNLLELPASQVAAGAYPTAAVVSPSTWSSSPAGQANVGTLIPSIPDSSVPQRQARAGASRLPNPQSVSPSSGPHAGGTATTITGWGLSAVTAVIFGPNTGTALTGVSDSEITVTTPAGATGPVNVVVQSPAGQGVLSGGYTFT